MTIFMLMFGFILGHISGFAAYHVYVIRPKKENK